MKDFIQVGIVIYLNDDGSAKCSSPILTKATPELLAREQKLIADMEDIKASIIAEEMFAEELETTLLERLV